MRAWSVVGMVVLLACDGESTSSAKMTLTIVPTLGGAPPLAAGSTGTARFKLQGQDGKARTGVAVAFHVTRGGGSVEPASAKSDADGVVEAKWTLGKAPVTQYLAATATDFQGATLAVDATLAAPWPTEPFGQVDQWLTAHGNDGSTEDLAFAPGGERLVVGVPGALLVVAPSGGVTEVALSGDKLEQPLGMQFDGAGVLWVADSKGKALHTIQTDGPLGAKVATTLTKVDGKPLLQPNDLFVLGGGKEQPPRVWLTDPCRGEVFEFDAKTNTVKVVAKFDRGTQGGPNGVVATPDGKTLYVASENVALTCIGVGEPVNSAVDAKLGSLWRIDLTGTSAPKPVAEGLGVFGDGLQWDTDGNLYGVFDTAHAQPDLGIDASTVWVWPKTQSGLGVPVKFLETKGKLYANIVFAPAPFGKGRPYLALLAVPPFTPQEARGIERL
jgi:streptogramin lyase